MTGNDWNIKNSRFLFKQLRNAATFSKQKSHLVNMAFGQWNVLQKFCHIQQIVQMTTLESMIGQGRLNSAGGQNEVNMASWKIIWKDVCNYNIGGYMWPTIPHQILMFLIPFQLNLLTYICDTNTERRLSRCSNLLVHITNHHI